MRILCFPFFFIRLAPAGMNERIRTYLFRFGHQQCVMRKVLLMPTDRIRILLYSPSQIRCRQRRGLGELRQRDA